MPDSRPRPSQLAETAHRQPDPETDVAIARHQHQQDALNAIDAADRLLHPWRAALAAGNPSIAVIQQISGHLDRALVEVAQMVGLGSGAAMRAAGAAVEGDVAAPRFLPPAESPAA